MRLDIQIKILCAILIYIYGVNVQAEISSNSDKTINTSQNLKVFEGELSFNKILDVNMEAGNKDLNLCELCAPPSSGLRLYLR